MHWVFHNQIIDHKGENHYQMVHMNKAMLERLNILPTVLDATETARPLLEGTATLDDTVVSV